MKWWIFPILIGSCFTSVSAQEYMANTIAQLEMYAESHPVEKIYLHLDRQHYASGDLMYFRAYLTDRNLDPEGVSSHLIYVELCDKDRRIRQRTVLYAANNLYAGQMQLPDSLQPGYYYVRAYTNWMRNAGEEYFFTKDLLIGEANPLSIEPEPWDFSCGFYPEGGRLVPGVLSRVAFKAMSTDGFGADVTGELVDLRGNKIAELRSVHKGMGNVAFIPVAGMSYYAHLKSNGKEKRFTLPASAKGFSLMCYVQRDSMHVIVQHSEEQEMPFFILVQARGSILYSISSTTETKGRRIIIPVHSFPEGIVQITLYDEKGLPQNERLLFNAPTNKLKISVQPDQEHYAARDAVCLNIKVTDANDNPVEGSFSLSVTDDAGSGKHTDHHNIYAYMHLNADLKGYIEDPGWYFMDRSPERKYALDILLCTQGWRRVVSEAAYPVESDFTVSGKVVGLYGLPAKGVAVHFFDPAGYNFPGETETDKEGDFSFIGFNAPEGSAFLLRAEDKKKKSSFLRIYTNRKDSKAEINRLPYYPHHYLYPESSSVIQVETGHTITAGAHEAWNVQLSDLTVTHKRDYREQNRVTDKTLYSLEGDLLQQFNFEGGLTEALSLLPSPNGLPLHAQGTPEYGAICLIATSKTSAPSPADFHEIMQIPVWKIEKVETIPASKTIRPGERPRGTIIVYLNTSREKPENEPLRPGLEVWKPEGYAIQRTFYVPPYHIKEAYSDTLPDVRPTLYWQPTLLTDSKGEGFATFYTADQLKTYSIILEGIGSQGMVGYGIGKLQVDRPKKEKEFDDIPKENAGSIESKQLQGRNTRRNMSNILDKESIQKLKCQDIYCVLQHINGLRVSGNSVTAIGSSSISSSTTPLIIIDGMPGDLTMININTITYIEFDRHSSMYGARGANGVIVIKTR